MGIFIHGFDPDRISVLNRLFPDEIDTDVWVMFHGTSGYNAESIERDGFSLQSAAVSGDQIQRVTNIFELMKWTGESFGGYGVLKAYSLGHDLVDPSTDLLFFAETSPRALLYATRDFSGGEKLRALRIAFRDLDSYLSQSQVREWHQERMRHEFHSLTRLNAHPSIIEAARPLDVHLDWLSTEIASVEYIRLLADSAYERHDYGVVYSTDDAR